MTADETLNELLVGLFKDIMEIEGRWLVTGKYRDISCNDFHILEAVGMDEPKSMTEVARRMKITTGTLTKAMDALTEKGYAVRERSLADKRVVCVYLTQKGREAFLHHEEFHRKMIEQATAGLSEKEMPVLIDTLTRLVQFFHAVYGKNGKNK